MSMRSPSATVTIARLVSLRFTDAVAGAPRLAGAVDRLTDVTLTLNTFSTAILISVLFASGTRKVYLFASSRP